MTEDQTIRCNFCGNPYDGTAANCPSCNFPTPGATPTSSLSNRRIGSRKVLVVGGVAALAVTAAIVLSVVMTDDDDPAEQATTDPVTGAPATSADLRPEAWASTVNGAVSSQVALPDAVVLSTSDSLTRIDADGGDAWITALDADADVVAASADGAAVLTERTSGAGVGLHDAQTGELRWYLDGLSYVASIPDGTLVRAGTGPFGLVDDAGSLVWRVESNDQVAVTSAGEPAEIVFVRTGPTLTGLDARTGEELWSQRTTFRVGGGDPPALAATDDMVVMGAGGQIVGYDADTGDELWAAEGDGNPPQIQQFGEDLIAVAFDADSATTLYGPTGEQMTLTGTSRSALDVVSFMVEGISYAADTRNATVYDSAGSRVGTYAAGEFTAAPDGYFSTAQDVAQHYALGADAADFAVPAPSGAVLVPVSSRTVLVSGSNVRGY